jgi:hypothetical protein
MLSFEPLIRMSKIAFPYWMIVSIIASVVAASLEKRPSLIVFITISAFYLCTILVILFIVAGIYTNITGNGVSFAGVIPSAFIISALYSAACLAWFRSKQAYGFGMGLAGFIFLSIAFSLFLAVVVTLMPKLLLFVAGPIERFRK